MAKPVLCLYLFISAFIIACNTGDTKKQTPPQRAFYYWKSVFRNNVYEQQRMRETNAGILYVKFFDVDWNYAQQRLFPLAQIQFADTPARSFQIIPVIFITNRSLLHADSAMLPELAKNIASLAEKICAQNGIASVAELQIDCDWSDKTRDKYFYLLELIKQQPYVKGKQLSATIRLHQVKFKNVTGVPPVDKGLLMLYNMGNLKELSTTNSILDENELKSYTAGLDNYTLPLDMALPLFSWYVWFNSNNSYKGLLHDYDIPAPDLLPVKNTGDNLYRFTRDCDTAGFSFREGETLRVEKSSKDEIAKAGKIAGSYLDGQRILSCFHLDSIILAKYSNHDLEKIFTSPQH
jgi:hypothetical protein